MCVCMHAYMLCVCAYATACVCACVHVYTYACVHVRVCMCVLMYMCVHMYMRAPEGVSNDSTSVPVRQTRPSGWHSGHVFVVLETMASVELTRGVNLILTGHTDEVQHM